MTRVLVTGATGGLGRSAVDALLAQGTDVVATGRNTAVGSVLAGQGAQFIALDLALASPADLQRLLAGADVVWHCAALSSPWGRAADFVAANVVATQGLLAAAAAAGVTRFVHISTPAVYFDYTARLHITEDFRPAAYVNAYARTKADAEVCVAEAAQQHPGMHCTVLRPRAIFGRYDQVLMPRLARVLAQRGNRLPLPRGGQALLDITYADNVVQAMQLASAPDAPQRMASGLAFNITNHQPVVLRDVLHRLFAQLLGQPFHIQAVPYPVMMAAACALQAVSALTGREPLLTPYSVGTLAFDMTLCNRRATEVLGYVPAVSVDDGLIRTAQGMRHGR